MYNFDYTRATSADQAAQILADDEDATLIAGGQTLIPTLKQRLAAPSKLVDISGIDTLCGIAREGDRLAIGAMTRHAEVHTSAIVRDALPGLAELAGMIGDPHVRHRGTLGGSVANNDPAADYPAALLALGATVTTSKREIAADDFFVGLFETALEEAEIVTRITFPVAGTMAYAKHRNPASRYALAGVCIARSAQAVRVAVIGSGQNGVFRWEAAEQALTADFSTGALDGVEVEADTLMSDIHGQADYRANLIRVMTLQAVGRLQG